MGFGAMRFVLVLAKSIAGQLSAAKVE